MVRRGGGGRKTQNHKLILIDSWAHQELCGVLLITPPPIPPIMDTKVFRPEGGGRSFWPAGGGRNFRNIFYD